MIAFLVSPTPGVTWARKDGQQMPPTAEYTESGTTLTLTNIDWNYDTEYVCVGSNNVDSVEQSFALIVQCRSCCSGHAS